MNVCMCVYVFKPPDAYLETETTAERGADGCNRVKAPTGRAKDRGRPRAAEQVATRKMHCRVLNSYHYYFFFWGGVLIIVYMMGIKTLF